MPLPPVRVGHAIATPLRHGAPLTCSASTIFYAIRFPEPTIPARISMEPGPEYQFPAHFEVLGLIGGDRWVSLPLRPEGGCCITSSPSYYTSRKAQALT